MSAQRLILLDNINPSDFEKMSIYLKRPYLIGFYSYSYENCTPGNYIKYLKEPNSNDYPLNLNDGYVTFKFREHSIIDSRLRLPLNYAMSAKEPSISGRHTNTTVYTSRRVLTKLMEYCYAKYDFIVSVSRYNGNLYMAGDMSHYLTQPANTHHNRLEQILFSDSPDENPKIDEPLDENVGLSCLHRAILGKYNLLYAGEVQGIIADKRVAIFDDVDALNECRFVFVKQMWARMRKDYKFLNYWIQAYLAGVGDIYVAYKNSNAIVEQPIEHIKVSTIPTMFSWKPEVCVGFLNDFLKRLEKLMSNVNCLDTVYEFHFNPSAKTIHYEIYNGKTDKSFIPKVYADFITK